MLVWPSELLSGVQCLVVALTGPLCWILHGSTLATQDVLFSDFLMASMLVYVAFFLYFLESH